MSGRNQLPTKIYLKPSSAKNTLSHITHKTRKTYEAIDTHELNHEQYISANEIMKIIESTEFAGDEISDSIKLSKIKKLIAS